MKTDQQKLFESYLSINEDLGLGPSVNGRGNMNVTSIGQSGDVGNSHMDISKSQLSSSTECEEIECCDECQRVQKNLYMAAKYAVQLFDIVQRSDVEPWMIEKISKAAEYLDSVYHELDFEANVTPEDGIQDDISGIPDYEIDIDSL